MSTVSEVQAAVESLPPEQRRNLFRWLNERNDFQEQRLEDLRRDIAIGIEQADRGALAPLDLEAVEREARQRLSKQEA